jgi:hypothetical protein
MALKLVMKRVRSRVLAGTVLCTLLSASMTTSLTSAGGIEYVCNAELLSQYKRNYGITCRCTSSGKADCDSPASGSSSSGGGGGKKGLSSKNQMKLQMLQGAMDDFANSFIKWINAPPNSGQSGPTPEQIAAERVKQEAEMARAKAEWLAKVQKQISEMESEHARMERQETANRKGKILSGLKGMGSGRSGGEPPALQQLRCTAYWNDRAAKATDEKTALNYRGFAEKPDNASMAQCDSALPEPPMPDNEFRTDLYVTVMEEISQRLPMIEQAKTRQREADNKVTEIKKKAAEVKDRQTAAASPEEKQATDDLMAQILREEEVANQLKIDADAGVARLQMEIDALTEVKNISSSASK